MAGVHLYLEAEVSCCGTLMCGTHPMYEGTTISVNAIEGWYLERSTSPESYISLFAYVGEIEKAKKILDSPFDRVNHYFLAMGHLVLGDFDNAFRSIQAGIENHDQLLLECLIVAEWWSPIRDDPRFGEMLELLDSKVTHTEQYMRTHDISYGDQSFSLTSAT